MNARVNQKKSFQIINDKNIPMKLLFVEWLETVSGVMPGEWVWRAQPLGPIIGWWLSWNPSSGSCLSLSWTGPGVSWLVNVVNWVSLRLCPLNRLSPSSLGCRSSSHETVTPHSNYNRILRNITRPMSFLTLLLDTKMQKHFNYSYSLGY